MDGSGPDGTHELFHEFLLTPILAYSLGGVKAFDQGIYGSPDQVKWILSLPMGMALRAYARMQLGMEA